MPLYNYDLFKELKPIDITCKCLDLHQISTVIIDWFSGLYYINNKGKKSNDDQNRKLYWLIHT